MDEWAPCGIVAAPGGPCLIVARSEQALPRGLRQAALNPCYPAVRATGSVLYTDICLSRVGEYLRTFLRILLWVVAILVVAVGAAAGGLSIGHCLRLTGPRLFPDSERSYCRARSMGRSAHSRCFAGGFGRGAGLRHGAGSPLADDLLRRVARGQLSEILGPATLSIDKDFRTLGFSRAAARDVAQWDAESRKLMEAYARE